MARYTKFGGLIDKELGGASTYRLVLKRLTRHARATANSSTWRAGCVGGSEILRNVSEQSKTMKSDEIGRMKDL
jgi:hypothetical protein